MTRSEPLGRAGGHGAVAIVADEMFAKVFRHSYDMIMILDPLAQRILDANPMACRRLGYSRDELLAISPAALHPTGMAQFQAFVKSVLDEGSGWAAEMECVTKTGEPLPSEISASRIDLGGRACMLAVVRDLTEHKRAEVELRGLSKRIVQAQEAERRRVARELHDSVNQLLSSVRFRIQALADSLPKETAIREQAERTVSLLEHAINELRRISHNLRPSELDDLGLVPAVRGMCHDFQDRTAIVVDLRTGSLTSRLTPDAELTCYRIIQEALGNVEKHSRATRVRVALTREGDAVGVRIADNGRGMPSDRATTRAGRGLGLVDMRERAAFLGGSVSINASAGGGTEVVASIPEGAGASSEAVETK